MSSFWDRVDKVNERKKAEEEEKKKKPQESTSSSFWDRVDKVNNGEIKVNTSMSREDVTKWANGASNVGQRAYNFLKTDGYKLDDKYESEINSYLDKADHVAQYLRANKNSFDNYDELISSHYDSVNYLKNLRDGIGKSNEYYSKWNTDELVQKHGSAEEAYKYDERAYGYSKKHEGKTSTELQALIDSMEDGEEKEWLKSYEDIVGRKELLSVGDSTSKNYDPDFDKYVAAGKEYLYMDDAEYNRRVAEYDDMYFNAKTNEEIQAALAGLNALKSQYNNIKRTAPNFEGLDAEEQKVYLYHLGKDLETGTMDFSDTFYEELTGRKNNAASNKTLDYFKNFVQKPKALEDGFDWYDALLVPLGTLADIGVGLVKGAANTYEGIVDYAGYGVAGVADILGADGFADTVRGGMRWSATDALLGGISDFVDQASISGSSLDMLAEGVGQVLSVGKITKAGQAALNLGKVGTTVLSSLLTFSSSAGLGITEAYESGVNVTDAEAFAYGTMAGTAEALSELLWSGAGKLSNKIGIAGTQIGLDELVSQNVAKVFSGTFGRNVAQYMIGGAFEGVEGLASGFLQAVAKKLTYLSEEDFADIIANENLMEQFIAEALTSFLVQSPDLISKTKAGRDLITGLTDSETFLLDTEFDSYLQDSKAEGYDLNEKQQDELYEKAQNIISKLGEVRAKEAKQATKDAKEAARKSGIPTSSINPTRAKSLTKEEVRGLLAANNQLITAEDTKKIQKAAEARLTELGQTKDVQKLAELATKYATGQKLSKADKAFLANNKNGNRVANELIPENIMSGEYTSEWAEGIGTKQVNKLAYNIKNIAEQMAKPATYKSLTERVGEKEKFNVSESGKATVNGEEITLNKKVEVVDFVRDKETGEITDMIINADGKQVKASEIDYADEDQSYLFSAVRKIENITPADAQVIIRDYDPSSGISVGEYLNGIDEAYTYGYHNYTEADMKSGLFTTKLSDEKSKGAYELGKLAKKNNKEAKSEAIKRMRTAVEAETEKAVAEGKPAPKPEKMAITYNKGNGVVTDFEKTGMKLSKKQRAGVEVAKILHELGLGTNFEFFESIYKDGHRVFINDAGLEQLAPAGVYMRSDGTIRIDLNAYNGRQLTLYTLSHELTHFIQQWSTEKYEVLAEYLVSTYEKTGLTMHQRVLREQARLKGIRGEDISYNEAYDEVVANAMMKMFDDGNLVQRLTELKAKDKNLAMKLWEGFKEILNKLLGVYQSDPGVFNDTKDLTQMKEDFEVLQGMFAEALVEASENFQAAQTIGFDLDAETESISPAVMNSEQTWTESDYVQQRDNAAKEIAKAIGVSVKKAKDYIDSVNSIAKMIAEDRSRLDYFSSPGRSSFVDNAEYGGSFDFSTLCKKRRLLTGTFTAIQKALPNTALTANEILDIRNRMKEAGLEVSCGLCYVEGSRANMGQFAKEFLRLYKQYYPDAWQPNMADVNTPDGIEWVRINHPECYEQYEYFWNHYGTLKDGDKNLFASQQKPKLYQLHTEYKGEILNKFKNDDKVEDKNLNGGIRLQSFSDFEIVHLIDTMQIIMDMSRVGLAGQAYTKVPDFAWALGDTGLKINLSLIAKGVDENGKLIFDDVEGMPIADAMKLRDRYSKNVGTILVAFNDAQLLSAMADERVDFIIPFHRSQWKKSQYEAMGLPAKTKDYTFMQNEKFIKPTFHEYRGRMVKDKATNYMPNEYWDFSKSGKENAEAYLEMCARNNKRPKFYKLLTENGDGSYSLKADGSTDGYWKLLIDFKMYDNDGNGSPQMAVKPDFNMQEATRMLNDYSGGHSNFPVAQGIVDSFVKDYKDSHKGEQYSSQETDLDTETDSAYDGGKKKTEQEDKANVRREEVSHRGNVESQGEVGKENSGRESSKRESCERRIKEILRKKVFGTNKERTSGRGRVETKEDRDDFESRVRNDGLMYVEIGRSALAFNVATAQNENASIAASTLRKFGFDVIVFQGNLQRNGKGVTETSNAGIMTRSAGNLTIFISSELDIDGMETAYHEAFHAARYGLFAKYHEKIADIIASNVDIESESFAEFISIIADLYTYTESNVSASKFVAEIIEEFYAWYVGKSYATESGDMQEYMAEFSNVESIKQQIDSVYAQMETNKKNALPGLLQGDSLFSSQETDLDSDGNKLTEDQAEFFVKSKVRDGKGNLKVLYHGSKSAAFTEFDISKGVWLTPVKSYAEDYAEFWDSPHGINGFEPSVYADKKFRLYKMYANIKNPADIGELNQDITGTVIAALAKALGVEYSKVMDIASNYEGYWVYEMTRSKEFIDLAADQGFDGFKALEMGMETWCAFSAQNQVKLTTNEVPSGFSDIRYSSQETDLDTKTHPYAYDTLVGKPDMVVTTVDGNVPKNRADVVYQAKQNAAKMGKFDPKTGSVSVYVDDIGVDVVLGRDGLKHSLDRRLSVNAPVVLKAGEILKRSICINETTPQKAEASQSYVLIGTAMNENGELYIVRSVINRFSNELSSIDVLYAINAKKESAALLPLFTDKSALGTDSTISIAELLDLVNQYFPDVLPEDVLKHYGYDARPEGDLGKDALYSTQETDNISNRDMLANAFETLAQNSEEYKMIQKYKNHIRLLNEYEDKLSKLNAEIYKMTFGNDGNRDSKKLRELRAKAKEIAGNINRHDKELLNLEASEPLRKVIQQERKKAAQKTREHIGEIMQNKKARAEQTEYRHKIRRVIRDLNKILKNGNKKQNVKEDMKGFVSKALELADYLFQDHVSNDDLIRKGITVQMRGNEAQLVKETEEILNKLYDEADSLTDEEFTRLDAKRKRNLEKLRGLLTEQRNERLQTPVYKLFDDLVTEYASLKNSSQESVKAAYDPNVESFLRSYIGETDGETNSDRKTLLQNMRVADMTTDELWKLYNAYTMVLKSVRDANKLHVKGRTESIDQMVTQIVTDFGKRNIPDKKLAIVARNISNKIGWDYEKLYYALDRIGSNAFTELIMNLANSENIVMRDVIEAAEFRDQIVEKYGFNNWDVNKEIDKEFLDNTGKKFKLTLGQLMSLYAYSRRDGAWDHIEYGGFAFGKAALTNPKPADSYKLSKEQCMAITNTLTKEQKAYVEDMQKFLSETMGAKGNEVSMELYGIKMFNEKNYFPIHIAGDFKPQAKESQAKAEQGFQSMSNAGFTHAQNPNAKAPFVLEDFNDIWADHVNEMSRYHGTVPALEDIRRVMNRSSYSETTTDSTSVKVIMKNHFGEEAVNYFDNLYREANSGAITDKLQGKSKRFLSFFRKGSTAYSLSVWVQQPASIVRAYAMIDRKYFGVKGIGVITSGVAKAVTSKWNKAYANSYNEMLKYAPGVTMAKDIGGFDTATGGSIRSYLLDTGKSFKQKMKTENLKGKGKAVMDLVDDNAIANLPNVADKIAWIEIWNACKRETAANHKDLATSSDEFMQIVGERFTEVIRATQVYDSIFAKSPMLKSKNLAVQYLVSFMNEPNTVANMAESAVRDLTRGNVLQGLRKTHVLIHSIIFTSILKSMIYAMRDDDEDETYIEKYIEAITGSLMDDFNALNYIPFARDVWSVAQGYDVERADMAIVSDAISALNNVIKNAAKDTDGMTEDELVEFDKKATEASWDLVVAFAGLIGIPAKNIRREIKGVIDHARIASANAGKTTAMSAWDKFSDAIIESIPFMSNDKTKNDKLYSAIVNGDTAYVDRIKDTYKTDDSYHNAVRTALRENDPRIKEAARARYEGKTEEYKRIFREIQNEGNFSFDDIMSAVNSEETKIRNGVEPDKTTSSYSTGGFVEAIILGDKSSANAMKQDIISTYIANGNTKEEADKEFKSDVTSSVRDAYSSGLLNEARAKKMLQEYAGKDEEEATSKVNYWVFCEKYPKYKDVFTESHLENYNEFGKPAGISVDMYAKYINSTKGLATKYDKWGDVEVSKREQVLEAIDSLPITRKQKDALYLAADYAESKIWDVPWR